MLGREVWLTWLRRPLARTVSEYLHAKANLVVWDYAMPATFLEFVTSREYSMPLARKTAWYGCLEGAHSLLQTTWRAGLPRI